jgi:hypothetical protein
MLFLFFFAFLEEGIMDDDDVVVDIFSMIVIVDSDRICFFRVNPFS